VPELSIAAVQLTVIVAPDWVTVTAEGPVIVGRLVLPLPVPEVE
jgi:hypothetical protein